MTLEDLKPLQVKEIIRSEFRQLPETRWGPKSSTSLLPIVPANSDLDRKSGRCCDRHLR